MSKPIQASRIVYGLSLLMCTALGTSCGKATITRWDGTTIAEGKILRSDAEKIYVEQPQDADSVFISEFAVNRSEIADIDHPGNVTAVVATAFNVVGLAMGFGAMIGEAECSKECDDERDTCGCGYAWLAGIPGFIIVGASLPFAIWGWTNWGLSVRRAGPLPQSTRAERCDDLFSIQEHALARAEASLEEGSLDSLEKARDILVEAAEREDRHLKMCFDHYESGVSLRARRQAIEEKLRRVSPGGSDEPEDGRPTPPADPQEQPDSPAQEPLKEDEWKSTEEPPTFRFLGIAPLMTKEQDLKGVVIGFQF